MFAPGPFYRYAMNFAALDLKKLYFNKNPKDVKIVHIMSSGFKAMFTWHSMRTLQVYLILWAIFLNMNIVSLPTFILLKTWIGDSTRLISN